MAKTDKKNTPDTPPQEGTDVPVMATKPPEPEEKKIDTKAEIEKRLKALFSKFSQEAFLNLCYRMVTAPPLDVYGVRSVGRIGEVLGAKDHQEALKMWEEIKEVRAMIHSMPPLIPDSPKPAK